MQPLRFINLSVNAVIWQVEAPAAGPSALALQTSLARRDPAIGGFAAAQQSSSAASLRPA